MVFYFLTEGGLEDPQARVQARGRVCVGGGRGGRGSEITIESPSPPFVSFS